MFYIENMISKILILTTVMLSHFLLVSQEQFDIQIQDSFSEYKSAVMSKDTAGILKYSHPNIIRLGGGEKYFVATFLEDIRLYERAGLKLVDIKTNQASRVLRTDELLQAMLPYERIFKKGDQEVSEKHFYLVMLYSGGENWIFTDMRKHDSKSIKQFVPEYNDRLNIYINSITHE